MKMIPLTRGQFAKVDDADYGWLTQWKWSLNSGYACRGIWDGAKVCYVSMHRLLLGLEFGDPRKADHVNRDTLDNQRVNLRIATSSQNAANRSLAPGKLRGVNQHDCGRWQVNLTFQGKRMWLGCFNSPQEAASARDKKFKELHGEFAMLNGAQ